jgi:hypothetical protein
MPQDAHGSDAYVPTMKPGDRLKGKQGHITDKARRRSSQAG